MDAYCAEFKLRGTSPEGKAVIFSGYSEHVWIEDKMDREGREADMLHFAADSLDMSIGAICQVVADLGGSIDYEGGWLDAYVPMQCVRSIAFEVHSEYRLEP